MILFIDFALKLKREISVLLRKLKFDLKREIKEELKRQLRQESENED